MVANGAGNVDLHVGDNVTVTITLHAGAVAVRKRSDRHGRGVRRRRSIVERRLRLPLPAAHGRPGRGRQAAAASGAAGTGGAPERAAARGGDGGRAARGDGRHGGGRRGGTGGAGRGRAAAVDRAADERRLRRQQRALDPGHERRPLIYDQTTTLPTSCRRRTRRRASPGSATTWSATDAALRQNIQIPDERAAGQHLRLLPDPDRRDRVAQCDYALRRDSTSAGTITKLTEWNNENANTRWAFFSTFVNGDGRRRPDRHACSCAPTMDDGVNTSFYFDSLSVTANVCP